MIRRIVKKIKNKKEQVVTSASLLGFSTKKVQEENVFAYPEPEFVPKPPIGCVIVKQEAGVDCPEQLYVYVHSMMEMCGTLKKKWYWKQISFPKNKWPETINSGAYFCALL